MDFATIAGVFSAFTLIYVAITSGGVFSLFLNLPSAILVFGCTLGSILVHYPFKDLLSSIKVFKKAITIKAIDPQERIAKLIQYSTKARKEGILALQSVLSEVDDDFLAKGLQLAVDGQEPDSLKDMLEREIDFIQARHDRGADIFVAMGTYAPAMGMIGTLVGLVQMLQVMNDPTRIGPSMAIALLTTLYGAILANIICMPVAGKLKTRSAYEVLDKMLISEGLRLILRGENPRIIEQKLHAFVSPRLRKSNFNY
jgi:chemotaxis protein MotA